MFGLLRPRRDLAHPEDWKDYQSAYCNLCAGLAAGYGLASRLLVVHDIAAADWLLAGAAPAKRTFPVSNCLKGGLCSAAGSADERERFLAAVSAYTVGVKVQDQLTDEPGWKARAGWLLYRDTFARARGDLQTLGFGVSEFEEILSQQRALEARGEADLVRASAPSGSAFGLVARHLAGLAGNVEGDTAFRLGETVGRSVFLVDAWEDFRQDVAGGAYNPLRSGPGDAAGLDPGRQQEARELLGSLLGEARRLCALLDPRTLRRWQAAGARLSQVTGDRPQEDSHDHAEKKRREESPPTPRGRSTDTAFCDALCCACDVIWCGTDIAACC